MPLLGAWGMDSWRRQKGEIHHRPEGARSHNRKPQLASWQPTVPTWEKKFCTLIGAVPWKKLLETKRSMFLYDNVVKWNDSAGEEAFHNAKNRFWAEINNLPCDISPPNPDIYIDEIDWNSEVDPELLRDLERGKIDTCQIDKAENVGLGAALLSNQTFSCTGWGDAEEDLTKMHNGVALDSKRENFENHLDRDCQLWDAPWQWNQKETFYESNNMDIRKARDWGAVGKSGQYMSRYKTSRFEGHNQQTDHGWRNVKKHQKPKMAYDRGPTHHPRQWSSMNHCRQNHSNGFGKGGIPWRGEKQVL